MNIAVLGAVCYDEIFAVDGERRESFGGILYNAAALSSVLDEGDRVVPVSRLGADRYEAALAEFAKFERVDTAGLTPCADPFTHVTLRWRSASWRDETVRHRMPPFDLDALAPALACDAAHINFINGTEIDLDTLAAFRACFGGLITFDVHNIISHFDAEGARSIVGFSQWRDWAGHIDVLQCNEFEIATMLDGPFEARADYAAAAKAVCEAGPRAVSITLGTQGALTVHRRDGRYYLVDIDVLPPIEAVDTTGCGDSFSAGFVVGMLRYGDPATALACASAVAGVNAQHRGIGELADAKRFLEDPRSHFEVFRGKAPDWPGDPI
ncbi:MAG: carbohydrate kinase family protein [Candidatus Hydrogenedentes bacterium]|nr:carbohydrate kinase family protein [Candidatus Hydrogenedentota bacterium]